MDYYFPTYLATGKAFCNRTEEVKRAIYNLSNGIPVLLMSPRRYGKTSLALKAIEGLAYPYAHIDLYKAFSEEDITRFVLTGIGQLLGQIESAPKKLIALAGEFFGSMEVRVSFEKAGLSLDFSKKKIESIEILLKALEQLQVVAAKKQKQVILFLDEFQMVGEVTKNHALEATFREIAQKSKNILFIFSGSNRHLIEQMFFDKKRPFYKLCDMITLHRINAKHYFEHLQIASKQQWQTELDEKTIENILALTARHPYYVNKLCSLLWQRDKKPEENDVIDTWKSLVLENKSMIERELLLLSPNQRKLLILFSENENVQEIFAKDFLMMSGFSLGGLQKSLKYLLEMDYLFQDIDDKYKVLDPLIRSALIYKH